MDYSRIYIELMERASNRVLEGYSEKHHIIPRCMGGDDKPRNIAVLTPEEHYLAHQLLVKIYPNNPKLVYAASMMTTSSNGERINNKLFGWIKRKLIGIPKPEETRLKMSKAQKGNTNSKGKKKSQSYCDSLKGNKRALGLIHSKESRQKKSDNISKAKGNRTGYVGVKKSTKGNTFEARVTFNGKRQSLGSFKTAYEAHLTIEDFKTNNL